MLHRGLYMSALVLLILFNKLGKKDKMRGLPSILSLFRNEFNIFSNTRARILYDIKITLKSHFWRKMVIYLSLCMQRCYRRHNVTRKSVNHSGLSNLMHGHISLPDARRHVIKWFVSWSSQIFKYIVRAYPIKSFNGSMICTWIESDS